MKLNSTINSLHVLVTRPVGLAEPLCNEIESRGGTTTHFPVIEINDTDNKENLQSVVNTVNTYDIALFISPTAVLQTAKLFPLPTLKLTIGAIGEATSAALEKAGLNVKLTADGNNSESLLQHPLLKSAAIKNKRIIIFKGEGGRDLLTDTLSSRGASVFNANVYKRGIPASFTPLTNLTLQNIDAILVSSGEGLHNLIKMVVEKNKLMALTVIVPGERCAAIAKELGYKSIVVAANATNLAFIDALEHLDKSLSKLNKDKK